MPTDDRNNDRRIVDLTARLQAAEARLRQQAPPPASSPAPRERWLARTTSDSVSDYPASGNTFACELLSCHFPATPGDTAITEVERGRRVIARTRPAAYLERGTEVEVWRSRGHGALGSGEWWITTAPPATSKNRLFTGGTTYGRDGANVQRKEFGVGANNLRIFPGASENPTPDIPNVYLEGITNPANQGQAAIIAHRSGMYLVTATCTWTFPVISVADHNSLFDSLYGRVAAFAPAASAPIWMTGSPTSGAAHQHQYWPYVPLDMSVLAKLAIETSVGTVVGWGWSTAPVSAVASGITSGYRTSQMTVHGWWSPAVGETLTLDLSATYTDDAPYGFGSYQASLSELRISLLWIW